MGSDPAFIIFLPKFKIFQSTLPGWGATGAGCRGEMAVRISIHAPRMGSDETMPGTNDITYISIHAPRMGSDMRRANSSPRRPISIHAPRMGSDAVFAMPQVWWRISIHAPRMGSDPAVWVSIIATLLFQSTLPGWGATRHGNVEHHRQVISIHAPRMGSDHNIFSPLSVKAYFNPRSPDGERPGILPLHSVEQRFQSTLPGWGAT